MKGKDEIPQIAYEWRTHYGCDHIVSQLEGLNKIHVLLDYESDVTSLNSLHHIYVLSLCAYLEGLLRATYSEVMDSLVRHGDSLNRDERESMTKRLNELTWDDLIKKDKKFLHVEMSKEIKCSDVFKAIEIMFQLRNRLIHGNFFTVATFRNLDFSGEPSHRVIGKGVGVYDYLFKHGLLEQAELKQFMHFQLSPKVILHFVENTFLFAQKYCDFIDSIIPEDPDTLSFSVFLDGTERICDRCAKALKTNL